MAVEYVPYTPEPIQGQALLNNFTRTQRLLRYRGSDKTMLSIDRGMPLYEVENCETVGRAGSGNFVMRGECVCACAFIKRQIEEGKMRPLDLVYIDPPFASEANYAKQVHIRRNPVLAQKEKALSAQLEDDESQGFEETMYGDIWDKERYLDWMYQNLRAIKSVMAADASIYVHLDYHIGHYVKVLMDEVFGEDCFQSEIIWKRSTAHSDNAGFASLHDSIFFYSLASESVFNTQYVPYTEEYIEQYYRHVDEDGRRFLDRDLSAKGLSGGGYTYEWKGKPGYWRCPVSTMERFDREGRLYYTKNGTPRYKQYLDEMPGMPAQDLWTDIFAVNSQAQERVDYATQKPEALLERIIKASSNEGMLVADFFGGSGTTAAVAARLGRNFIHVDVGVNSVQTVRRRLRALDGISFDMLEIKDGVSLYRNPAQTMEKVRSLVPGLRDEVGLGSFWAGCFDSAREGMVPVHIPNLMDSSTKFLDKGLILRVINEEIPDVPDMVKRVILFYVDALDVRDLEGCIEEFNDTPVAIELRDLKPLLAEAVCEDDFEYRIVEDAGNLIDRFKTEVISFSSDRLAGKIDAYNMKGALKKRASKPIALSDDCLELVEAVSLDCTAGEGAWHADAEVYIDRMGYAEVNGKPTGNLWGGSVCSERRPLRIKVRNIAGDETVKVVR